jgi:hypothetical protein
MPWGGVKTETKAKFGKLIAQLHAIWYPSRFGSYSGERRAYEPYFANTPPSCPCMSFDEAAQHYGMDELRCRFLGMREAFLKMILELALEMLEARTTASCRPDAAFRVAVTTP